MDIFGSFALLLAFLCGVYAFVAGIIAIRTRKPLLIKSARNAGIRFYIVRERQLGQKAVPPLENLAAEGSFTFNLKPAAKIGTKERVVISQPGFYLLRVESQRTQRDHEHFAAIDLEIQ